MERSGRHVGCDSRLASTQRIVIAQEVGHSFNPGVNTWTVPGAFHAPTGDTNKSSPPSVTDNKWTTGVALTTVDNGTLRADTDSAQHCCRIDVFGVEAIELRRVDRIAMASPAGACRKQRHLPGMQGARVEGRVAADAAPACDARCHPRHGVCTVFGWQHRQQRSPVLHRSCQREDGQVMSPGTWIELRVNGNLCHDETTNGTRFQHRTHADDQFMWLNGSNLTEG